MPVFCTHSPGAARGLLPGFSPCPQKGGSSPLSPNITGAWYLCGDASRRERGSSPRPAGITLSFSFHAGSRRAYRGRPARQYAQGARDTPQQHSCGGRDRCPACAPAPWGNLLIGFGSPERRDVTGNIAHRTDAGGSKCDSLERHWPQPGGYPGILGRVILWQKQDSWEQPAPGRPKK